jgi:hypothetical protein
VAIYYSSQVNFKSILFTKHIQIFLNSVEIIKKEQGSPKRNQKAYKILAVFLYI